MKLVHEVFEEVASTRSSNEKKEILQRNNSKALQVIIRHMFDKNIKWGYKKIPEWQPDDGPDELSISSLFVESKKIHLLYDSNVSQLSEKNKERTIVRMLESIDKDDARMLEQIILGKFKVAGLTERLVRETFPSLLPENSDEKLNENP
jgi:hypothetical protein